MTNLPNLKNGNELIVYQISEIKNLVTNLDAKVDKVYESLEKRVQDLEKFKAALEERNRQEAINPRVDWQKIVLSLIGVISAMVLAYTTARSTGVIK